MSNNFLNKKLKNLILFIVSINRLFKRINKTGALLSLVVLSYATWSKASIYDQYKSKDFEGIVQTYGGKYTKLSYNELVLLSEAYKKLGNYDRQIKILKHLNGIKPNYYKIHLALAKASKDKVYSAIKQGKEYKTYQSALTDAIDFYRSSIKLEPDTITAYVDLMKIYKDQENVQEGLALTKSMLAKFGEKPQIVMDLCEWTSKFGLVSQTQKSCLRASELVPDNPKPLINYAISIRDAGEQEKYQSEMFKIFEQFPNSEEVVDLVGAIYIENKDYINAEKVLIKNKKSNLESSRINLASAFYENEKFDVALEYFSESCPKVNEQRKKLLRFFESRLRRLEINGQANMSFKFQKELNVCRSTPVIIANTNKVRPGDFSEGIRLPANARDIEGQTLRDKRYNYEQSRMKGEKYKVKSEPSSGENVGG